MPVHGIGVGTDLEESREVVGDQVVHWWIEGDRERESGLWIVYKEEGKVLFGES